MTNDEKALCKRLGYTFHDKKILHRALTHRSVSGPNNERLEFLGDSILNFIIAEAVCDYFPALHEGELSRLRANLVKGVTLAKLAREFKLGECLILGVGELKSGGFQRESILADSFEAIIAAIYIDGGLEICRELVLRWFEKRITDPKAIEKLKDPKTALQEYLQARKMALPEYTILKVAGEAHAQIFHVECIVPGTDIVTKSSDTTRRKAEQGAAKEFLKLLESSMAEQNG